MTTPIWPRRSVDELRQFSRIPVDKDTLEQASMIVHKVEHGGESALRELAEKYGDRKPEEPLTIGRKGNCWAGRPVGCAHAPGPSEEPYKISPFPSPVARLVIG